MGTDIAKDNERLSLPAQTVEDAIAELLSVVDTLPAEEVNLIDSLGRILAEDIVSDIDVAPFDNSAMDGFAVRAEDLEAASPENPVVLEVISHIAAGDYSEVAVERGQVARIMTGAPMPPLADTVVKVEDTSTHHGDGGVGSHIAFTAPVILGSHIRLQGEEVKAGDPVLYAGEKVTPAAVGLMAATGHPSVSVFSRPRVAIIATGSELVEVSEKPGRGKIRNSNNYSISAQVLAAGGIPVRFPLVEDTFEATEAAIAQAAETCDFIVTSGGVSVGDFDYVKPVLAKLGQMLFCKVNMRPGNPQTLGTIEQGARRVPFFGLPGNPTSTFVGFEIFVRPALLKMQGHAVLERPVTWARITHDARKRQDRRYYMRGRVEPVSIQNGLTHYEATISGNQSSALLTSAHKGNCLIILPEGVAPVRAGELVKCIRLDWEEGAL